MPRYVLSVAALFCIAFNAIATEPVTLEKVVDPGPNKLDEPLAKEFSLDRAVHFLDSASLQWQKQRKCFTCHTNLAYLYARPSVAGNLKNGLDESTAHQQVRDFAEELVTKRWPSKGPRWDAEVVATAAALAFNDAATNGKLHPVTQVALDRMWESQQEDGGWDWLKCEWPPFEYDNHYGVTLAAIAVGVAPDNYAETEAAQQGIAGIRKYFKNNPAENLHHRAMTLWASSYLTGLMSDTEKKRCVADLLALQKNDGGWAAATLGDWKRADETQQDTKTSDGYGTGFTLFVLRQAGLPKTDPQVQRAVQWLRTNQRESGRWISRSLYRDNKHFLSHAGSSFAVMALAKCR